MEKVNFKVKVSMVSRVSIRVSVRVKVIVDICHSGISVTISLWADSG